MKKILYLLFIAVGLTACSENPFFSEERGLGLPISLSADYPVVVQTRATANGFTNGDKVGIFVVDYEGADAGVMALSGNRASNVMFTYSETTGKWAAPMALYWATDGTPADIIGYYPFNEDLQSTTAQPFSVQRNQNTGATEMAKGGYEQSDLLWAKAEKVNPTKETVTLRYQHLMAGVEVRIERGEGFTAEEWAQLEKTVFVSNTQLNGVVDLTTGGVSATSSEGRGEDAPITALTYGDVWRAVVIPQTVEDGKSLVSITVDGERYELVKKEPMTYLSGRMHNFTITVNRRMAGGDIEFVLTDEAILPWEEDAQVHDGIVRAYTIIEVEEAGTLKNAIVGRGLDPNDISSLKVIGPINFDDQMFMGQEMAALTNLNLEDVILESGILTGFTGGFWDENILNHIVLPKRSLKKIGFDAFCNVSLMGDLTIPEGVEIIGPGAFYDCKFGGHLTLPSTIREIYGGAFSGCQFTGELMIPEGVEFKNAWDYEPFVAGYNRFLPPSPNEYSYDFLQGKGVPNNFQAVFGGCNFSGMLHLPSGCKNLTHLGFPGMRGDIVIPQGVVQLETENATSEFGVFTNGGYDGIVFLPDGVETIGNYCFANTKITGEIRFPSTLSAIYKQAFLNTRIRSVIFNDNISTIGEGCFKDCSNLANRVVWPKKCNRVSENVFENCSMLSGVVLHKDVKMIADGAFLRCSNLISIICEAEEPPLVGEDAFLGVSKWNAIVEVPASAVEKYKNAEGWSDFLRIVAHNDFDCQPQKVCALNKKHEEELVLYADGAWTVEHQPDWCTLSKTSGTGKTALELTVSELAHGQGNRSDSIVFRLTDKGYTTYCKVSQYDYEQQEDSYLALQQHRRGKGIDIVFAGDGWDAAKIADGSYLDLIRYQTECFFAIEPYRSMRDYFNVYVTFPLSQENGVNTMYTYVNNKFGTLHGGSSISGKCTSGSLITESDEVMNYVRTHGPNGIDLNQSLVILVPNSVDYGGNTILGNNGSALSICPPSENDFPRDTRGTIQHEAGGHGFGKLGDEMIAKNAFAKNEDKDAVEMMHWEGWYQNLSTTGKLHDVPWAEFIFDPDYSDRVDVFEGGYGYTRGIYRPESNSCMNYGIPYYNTPSRLAIWRRIKEYAGESWSMAEFRQQDTFEWGPTDVTRSSSAAWTGDLVPGQGYAESNRHVMPQMVSFKKMGNEVRGIREKLKKEKLNNR